MNRRRHLIAVGLAGALALTACGGDDAADAGSTTSTMTSAAPAGGPGPTISPAVPDAFLDGVGPMAVEGEPLPPAPRPAEEVDAAIGKPAPLLIGETVDGEPITVDATVDGPTWLIFLAHWCSHCNDEIPVINQLRDDGQIPEGVNIVGVSTAYNPERPNWPPDEWLDDKDWTYTAINDGIDTEAGAYIAADGFGIGGFPFSVLIDGDGIVTTRWSGQRGSDELVALLTEHLPLD